METALLRVLTDILHSLDREFVIPRTTCLLLLTPRITRRCLADWSRIRHLWFRAQLIRFIRERFSACRPLCGSNNSWPNSLRFDAPPISVVEPAGFDQCDLQAWLTSSPFASSVQFSGFCSSTETSAFLNQLAACVEDFGAWTNANCLQLCATKKVAVLYCSSRCRKLRLPILSFVARDKTVPPESTICDPGVKRDSQRPHSVVARHADRR